MKNLLLIIGILLMVIGCNGEKPKKYQVKMEIHYPSKIDTVTVENKSLWYPTLHSRRGSNIVPDFYETSAPIKILSITEIPDSTQIK